MTAYVNHTLISAKYSNPEAFEQQDILILQHGLGCCDTEMDVAGGI